MREAQIKTSARFELEVLPHLSAAYNLARWLSRNETEAEDILQESMLRAFRFFDDDGVEDSKAWLLQIVRHTYYSWFERRKKSIEAIDGEIHLVADASQSHEAALIESASVSELRTALESLPAEFREILVLREFEELSYRELSQVLGIEEGTVMSRLSRARAKLKVQVIKFRNEVARGK